MKNSKRKGITLSYIYFVINSIISIFMSAFIIRKVGQTDYGVYQSMTAFISYLVLLEFGTGTIMSRNISLCKKDGTDNIEIKKNVSTIWSFTCILFVIILIMSFVFWNMIDIIYAKSMSIEQIALGKKLFLFAAANLLMGFLQQTLNGLLIGNECYTFEKSLSIAKILLRTCALLVLLTVKNSIFLVVVVDFLLALGCITITFLYCIIKLHAKFVFKYFDKGIFKIIAPFALAMLLQTVVNTANGSVDKFLISIMMTPEDVSVYSVAMGMFSMFSSVATLPVSMFMPTIAKTMMKKVSNKELTDSLIEPCRLNALITGLVAFGFFCVGRPFVRIVYGEAYTKAWLYAMIIIFPMFVNMTNAVIVNVIDVLKKRLARSLILMVTTSLNIVLTIVAIKYIGMIGAASATAISLICQTIFLNVYYKKKIGIYIGHLFYQSYKGILPFLIIASIIDYIIVALINNVYCQLFIGGIVFVIIFAGLYMKFGMNEIEKNTFNKVIKKFVKNKGVK